MRAKFLVAIAITFFGVSYLLNSMRPDVAEFNQSNAARRQIDRICLALERGKVATQELCSVRIIEIPAFKDTYDSIRTVDGEWYSAHGWDYFPEVSCEHETPKFRLMDMDFECSSGRAKSWVEREEPPKEALGTPGSEVESDPIGQAAVNEPCFKKNTEGKLRSVKEVLPNGTVVLDGNERVKLAGVLLPPDKKSPVTNNSCLADTVRYISATLGSRSITVYRVPKAVRDEQFRLPVYIINQTNQLINQQLIRYGLARADVSAIKELKLECGEGFNDVERIARERTEGGWLNRCFNE